MLRKTHVRRLTIAVPLLGLALLLSTQTAAAKGCIKGAAVGAVAGHVAGHHAVAGAAVGCVVGHPLAKKKQQQLQPHDPPKPQPLGEGQVGT